MNSGEDETNRNSFDAANTDDRNESFNNLPDFETVSAECYSHDIEAPSSLHLLTKLSSLARHLESQHPCSKAAVDRVVNSVADILATAGCAIDISAIGKPGKHSTLRKICCLCFSCCTQYFFCLIELYWSPV